MKWLVLLLASGALAAAQAAPPASPSLFSQPGSHWTISGQANSIYQATGSFPAAFSGPNRFVNTPEDALSRVGSLFSAPQLDSHWELIGDLEVRAPTSTRHLHRPRSAIRGQSRLRPRPRSGAHDQHPPALRLLRNLS